MFTYYAIYCIEIWGNSYVNHTKPLFLIIEKGTKNITVNFREHSNGLFVKSGLLKLRELTELSTLMIVFKA